MSNSEEMKARLEDLKAHMYKELQSGLQKYKPSKHRKAYRIENNFSKRCYAR